MSMRSAIQHWQSLARVAITGAAAVRDEDGSARHPLHASDALAELGELQRLTTDVLCDCTGAKADRLRLRIQCAEHARELWLMRCDIFQVIASQHLQSVATERLNRLLPAFEGWLPHRLLTPA